ncbi:sensor histidine kinase [Aurantibacter crassamenti]|uniref:sensor histidine kinase n=1 Tax=Aurantibacter crassamenti TaxID=1837375 RepID=UPI00193AC998|nr:sensor histidine kinase [Aurantibacter crassamenti]MBM1106474.1 sensor histidine kinase [Aurantibacter crassamenti]
MDKKDIIIQSQRANQTRLIIRVCYFSSFFALIFGTLCYYALNITEVIPFVFWIFGTLNLLNVVLFSVHKKLVLTYNITSIMTLAGATLITLYSGGINSPFIFVLALIVVAGYVSTKSYGSLYLNLNLLIILLIYSQSIVDYSFTTNVIPEQSRSLFALVSVLFSVYLIGGVFGKNLLHAHHNLYKTKREIESRIHEKETLLKEIHHRVKNNLQTVSSLLSLQSRNIEDPKMKSMIKSSQNRVISMAMVHEMLYMRDDLSKIEYKSYVTELSEYLIRSLKGTDNNIKLNLNIEDVKLGIDTAIPLGLLINEAITNSLKYGIKDDAEGEINIELKKEKLNDYVLNIGDDGIGMSQEINYKNTKSLGLKLINNLTRQLRGTIERDQSKKGTNYIIRFKELGQKIHAVV